MNTGRERPQYSVYLIDLTTAGRRTIAQAGEVFSMIDARNADGTQNLNALVSVSLGTMDDDALPVRLNGKIRANAMNYQVAWEAQSGVIAYLLVASDYLKGPGVDIDAPVTKQIVTSAIGTTISAAAVTVATTATLLAAADTARQSVIVTNNGAADIFIGPAGVTTATGTPLVPGEKCSIDKTTAAIYGIVAAGTVEARVLTEA